MTWARSFRVRQDLKGSLWVAPLLGALLGVGLGWLDVVVDQHVTLPSVWQYSSTTASTVLSAIVGAMVALLGFVLTVSVLVLQTALSTFSARYLRVWYRDRMLKALLALLMGTLTFSFALLRRIESDFVPNLGVTISGTLVVVSLLMFLFFLDRFIHRLRPVAVTALVAELGRGAFADLMGQSRHSESLSEPVSGEDPALVVRSRHAGSIQAIDTEGLVRFARERECLLVFRHAVGDFVPSGAALIDVRADRAEAVSPSDGTLLRGMVALGIERTIEQDPAFAVRVMVDVAIRALSPAVNDPTTAVQVLNHLEETLRMIGTTDLSGGARFGDEQGRLRLTLPVRHWEDYLSLALTEIREYGAAAIQVMRRLRALLEELAEAVLSENRAAVEAELARLDASVREGFGDTVDADRAREADQQGIGGPRLAPRS
ncbi:MAG TPA: DUF2254 domain-containing protein [Gaiellaceae bacterium]